MCDLPHHGSYIVASPRWLGRVGPSLVLQSCGKARLRRDRWQPLLEQHGVRRLITARHGMVQLTIHEDGRMEHQTFRSPPSDAVP